MNESEITDETIQALIEITGRILGDDEAAATTYLPTAPTPTSQEGIDAYRAGRCSRCLRAPYAAGRTLCDPCWRDRMGRQ